MLNRESEEERANKDQIKNTLIFILQNRKE